MQKEERKMKKKRRATLKLQRLQISESVCRAGQAGASEISWLSTARQFTQRPNINF